MNKPNTERKSQEETRFYLDESRAEHDAKMKKNLKSRV